MPKEKIILSSGALPIANHNIIIINGKILPDIFIKLDKITEKCNYNAYAGLALRHFMLKQAVLNPTNK